ncbi:polysaccharide pyruvyl transferase family protein [Microbacterium halotolerans]|uniref:polysaccharide pyruvyl transferase family protein n=1 Tax=Microbacterium halotolerans TaxID=246613 RepID=UPI000E6ABC7F|nr:polysaccharide pyruvyl transferase family protein [Microbacterium halotolerans]
MTAHSNEHYDAAIVGVGIGANYGSVLTYYSLYKTVEGFGNKVLMVSKIGASASDPEIQDTHAMRFAREHYNLSKLYSTQTVGDLNQIADNFVIGSDQVWNFGIARNFGKAFYLDFADDDKRKISYAASFGHAKDFAPEEEIPKVSVLMKRFNAISVREDSGVRIAREVYGVPAKQVAEPIFLTDVNEYRKLASRSDRDVSGPYLLAYILDPTPEKKAAIEHIAAKKGLKVRVILDAWPHLIQENKEKMAMPDAIEDDIDTYDFLKLYDNSSYVVTDSFHGTAFSLKFEKPFASIGNRRRGVARFDSMFRLIGHRDRFTLEAENIVSEDERFLAPLDYTEIRAALDKHVDDSKQWLKSALEMPVRRTVGSVRAELPTPARALLPTVRRGVRFAKRVVRRVGLQRPPRTVRMDAPKFFANNESWQISSKAGETRLRVAGPTYATQRGNYVWTTFPSALREGNAYEVEFDWTPRSSSQTISVHLRNPTTGKFRVVGGIDTGIRTGERRTDRIVFAVEDPAFSQIMFGALHFGGKDGGADIASITLRPIAASALGRQRTGAVRGNDPVRAVRALGNNDDNRYIESYAQHRVSRTVENARSLLMYHAHGFEKGLSRTTNFRPGFGKAVMPLLSGEMNKWISNGRDPEDTFFQIAAAVMHNYFERHRQLDADVSHFWKLFDAPVQELITKADPGLGGATPATLERDMETWTPSDREFEDVVFSRRSVREFTADPVANEDIERAVQIALQAPSVCNRQPVRVHQFDDKSKLGPVLELQGGFRGYELPPKLLLVTSDHAAFVAAVERNQAYIDGGLFMMLLLLGLEHTGLGAVSLNTAMGQEREAAIREILGIPDSEVFISFIAVGHFDRSVLVPRSKRIEPGYVLKRHADD